MSNDPDGEFDIQREFPTNPRLRNFPLRVRFREKFLAAKAAHDTKKGTFVVTFDKDSEEELSNLISSGYLGEALRYKVSEKGLRSTIKMFLGLTVEWDASSFEIKYVPR